MNKAISLFLFLQVGILAFGQGSASSIPSPLISSQGGKIFINVSGTNITGGDAYLYSWVMINGSAKAPVSWASCISDKYKLTNEGSGNYSYQIASIQQHFGLTDSELATLTAIYVIARTTTAQTGNLSLAVTATPKIYYSGGEGSLSSPYLLGKSQDLIDLSGNTSHFLNYFKLTADIELTGNFNGIGTKANPFMGYFDGNGFAITNLAMNKISSLSTGFFNYIDGATISGLSIIGANVTGTTFTGAMVGTAIHGTVERCYTSGAVQGNGICVGGMAGVNENALFTNCYSTCSVNNSSDNATGGFVGKNTGTITNAYATGSISGREFSGGFAGANYGSIQNCVAVNNPMNSAKSFVARFGGNNNEQNKSVNTYSWTGIRLNQDNTWTNMGDHATMLNNSSFKEKNFFENTLGWDFASIWEWDELNYPKLKGLKTQVMPYPADFTEYTDVSELKYLTDVSVFPNPASCMINVSSNEKISKLDLFDITGKLLVSAQNSPVNIASLSEGLYILKIYNDDNQFIAIRKIIKL